jgi:hypothetical protein
MLLDSKLAGYFLVGAMGTVAVANPTAGVYIHTLTRNDLNTPQFLTVANDRVVDRQFYYDCAVDKIEIAVGTDLATMKASLKGNFPATTASGTNVTASGNVMSFRNAQFAFGTTPTVAKGNANLKVHDFKLSIANNIETVIAHGQATPRSITAKAFDVSAEFSLYFENTTDRDNYYAQNKQAACLQFVGNPIAAGGYNEYLQFGLYQTSIETFELETGLDNFYAEKVKLKAEYDNVSGKVLDITIQNTKALYI